ncbi:hypothetical protein G9A89_012904 [Geosiphon pyriformis]|nr:hypothetical protein G9A89_012904 [Geosiphon pyriformis]
MVVYQLIPNSSNLPLGLHSQNSGTGATQNPNSQNYLSLLVTPEDVTPSNPETNPIQKLISNIPPTMVTENKTLAAIFPFEFEETTPVPLFSGAALEEKPITAMYTDAKVDGHFIKLILNSGYRVDHAVSACIITADGVTKTPISKIDDFPFEINGIIIIKVLVIEATQYQAFVDNNWLSKTHTTLDWTTQELQLTFGATCGHFKPSNAQPLIEFEEETRKPTWEAYQISWANQDHNKLPPESKKKQNLLRPLTKLGKQKITTMNWPIRNEKRKITEKEKGKKPHWKRPPAPAKELMAGPVHTQSMSHYHNYHIFYSNTKIPCHRECYGYPKKQGKWDNEPCLTCSEQLLDKGMWNNIPTLDCLDGYLHDEEEIWQMANAKVEGITLSEILEIKNNLPELVNIICIPNPDVFMNKKTGPEDFHKYYQNLAPTREKQEQCLEQLNIQLCDHCLIPCDF